MHSKHFLAAFTAVFVTSTLGLNHGDFWEVEGKEFRARQVGPGYFEGVPVDEWDYKLHRARGASSSMNALDLRGFSPVTPRESELEERDLQDTCQIVINCAQYVVLVTWMWTDYMINIIEQQAQAAQRPIIDYLSDKPVLSTFLQNTGTFTFVAYITNRMNNALPPQAGKPYGGCQQGGTSVSDIKAALTAAREVQPDASEYSLTLGSGDNQFTLKVSLGEGSNPPPQQC